MKRGLHSIIYFLLLSAPALLYSQPANDNCSSATVVTLGTPAACTLGVSGGMNQGATTTLTNQTNIGATSSAPYPYIGPCPININSTPKDVWYSFVATGYQVTISVTGGTGSLTDPTIAMWGGTCANLEGMGCTSGTGGAATLTVYQTVIGQTYYIQVAGADSTQTGNFNLSVAAANNCATCVFQSFITPGPPPVNGTYNPGQTVEFCYTVTEYSQINANWLHGVTLTFGAGWDSASLTIDSLPPSCSATTGAYWGFYPNGETSSFTGVTFGEGFYYETTSGSTSGVIDADPGNNFGDDAASQIGGCDVTFCFSLTVNPNDTSGSDLSVTVQTSGDGESGSWSESGCGPGVDAPVTAYAVSSCSPPIMHALDAACHQNNGQDTAIAVGNYAPYIFHWSNNVTDTANRISVITGLAPGIYTVTVTNSINCITTASDTVFPGARPDGGPTQWVSCPSLIDSAVMTAVGQGTWTALSTNPAATNIHDPTSPTTTISGFTTFGTYNYVWTIDSCADTISVIVTGHPNAGPDVFTCVNGTATMAAIGTGTWAALPGNPAPTVIANPTANNTTVTGFTVGGTYKYVWYVGDCYDTADVIIPDFVSSASIADSVLCKYQTTTLSATAGPPSLGPFTYAWMPAGSVVSPTAASTSTQPVQVPTAFIVAVTSASGCVLYDTVNLALAGAAPQVHITPSDNNVCPGDTVRLSSQVYAENIVYCGLVDSCTNNALLYSYAVNNDTSSTTGAGGFTSVYGSPFMGSFFSYKAQYLFTKAELNAAGLSSGSITDISFFVKTINSTTPYDTFSVSMGCTDLDSLTGFVNNLSEVLPPQMGPNAITPNLGWTPLPFTNYYNWDGSSNLIVQVCYSFNPNVFSQDDFVSYTTTPYSGSSIVAGDDFTDGVNGCSLTSSADLYLINNTRPNIKFGMCVPNVLTYQWTPSLSVLGCDTCPNATVIVNADTTYTLTVNDNGCANDSVVRLTINPYLGITATPDTSLCSSGDTVRLHTGLSNPPSSQCVEGYTVTSIPYSSISGNVTLIPPVDYLDASGFDYSTLDGTAGPFNIGFNFPFYCEDFSQFYVNSNGWLTFQYPYPFNNPADEYTAQTLPSADPQPAKAIELMMGNYWLADGFGDGGGSVDYFITGTAPNRILVVQFNDMLDASLTYTTTGEMHLYETSGVIDIMISSSNFSGTAHTTGLQDTSNIGVAAPGMNNQFYTVTTPVAWRFTPQFGPSVAINQSFWSPNTFLSSDTVSSPLAYPPASQTYYVTDTLVINQFTHPSTCVVRDSVRINVSSFPSTVSANPSTICPGDTTQLTFSSTATVTAYSWTPQAGLSAANISNPLASVLDTTTYYIVATNNFGCTTRDSVTVNVLPTPQLLIGPGGSICYSDSMQLSLYGSYSDYQWFRVDSATGVRTLVSSGPADSVYYAHPSGQYVLEVTPLSGQCDYYTNVVDVDSFPAPELTVDTSGPTGFCVGGNVVLQVEQGYTNIQWTPASYGAQSSFPVTAPGTFSYTATDAHGCLLHSDTVHVRVSQPAAFVLNNFKNPICASELDTLIAGSSPAGAVITWVYNGAQVTGDTLVINTPGTDSIYADLQGCTSDTTITINTAPSPVVSLPAGTTECNCFPSDTIIATASGGTAPYAYDWSNGGTGPFTIDSLLNASTYTVTVTDANHCTAVSNLDSMYMSCPLVSVAIRPVSDTIFVSDTAILTASGPAGSRYSYMWMGSSVPTTVILTATGPVTGVIGDSTGLDTVYVMVTDSMSGCTASLPVTIQVVDIGGYAMASAFTPNGDGKNDFFYPVLRDSTNGPTKVSAFRIYDRWGQLVYDNPNPPGWDGNLAGKAQPSETYLYFVTIEEPDPNDASRTIQRSVEGSFQLFR